MNPISDIQTAPPASALRTLRALQIGVGWLPDEKGAGLDRVFYALAQHLPEAGVEGKGLVVGRSDVGARTDGRVQAFSPHDASLPSRLRAVRAATKAELAGGAFDLVAAHFALFAFPALGALKRTPLVVHFHGPWAAESQAEGEAGLAVKAKWLLERTVYRRAERLIVLSEAFRNVLVASYGIDPDRIRIVRGGVHLERFTVAGTRADARRRLGWPVDRPTLLVVRRLARRMGLENLIDAMEEVRRAHPDALLMIAGSGPIRDELQARIVERNLSEQVRLLGFVAEEDLPWAYAAADFSIVPTVALEGFGLITVESMATGTPVLVTNIGGLPEVVRDLSEDLIMPDAAPATLAQYIGEVLGGHLKLPTAEACRRFVEERYTWTAIARQTRDVYEEVVR
ncbi:MAG: glycosyltransferase family 4 protein [Rhodothermales bacterium]